MSTTGSSLLSSPLDLSPEVIQIIATIAVQSTLYGVFVVVMFFSTYFLCCKGFKTKANVMMLSVTTIIFATSTTYWASTLTLSFMSVRALYHPELITLREGEFFGGLYIAQIYLPMLNYILSDTIVAWRVWVLWQQNTRISIIPFVSLIGSFVSTMISAVYQADVFKSRATNSLLAAWALCLTTNVIATGLIACKAWKHRRVIKSYFARGDSRRTHTEKFLGLLVESGALYCIFMGFLIMTRFNVDSPSESELIQDASVQIAGIYPTVIVVLVTVQKTAWDQPFEDSHLKTPDSRLFLAPTTLPTHHSTRQQRLEGSEGLEPLESHRNADSSGDGFDANTNWSHAAQVSHWAAGAEM